MANQEPRKISLIEKDSWSYLHVKPPLTSEQVHDLPAPHAPKTGGEFRWGPYTETLLDGSQSIGFPSTAFDCTPFETYAQEVAEHLGAVCTFSELFTAPDTKTAS